MKILSVKGRQILDSRGNPTVEAEIKTRDGLFRAIVPSGASTGIHEAVELRDKKKSYLGKSVEKAVKNINTKINKEIKNKNTSLIKLDKTLLALDNTDNKRNLGANAILAVSMAVARAESKHLNLPLYKYIHGLTPGNKMRLPVPFANVINGGKHAGGALKMQEFMIAPIKAKSFKQATEWVSNTYHTLKSILKKEYGTSATNVGDEGGFAPPINTPEEALTLLNKAIKKAGYQNKMWIAMDPAASEFYKNGKYMNKSKVWMINEYKKLIRRYPIISLEDPFDQDDFESWNILKKSVKIQIVGDDLTVSNTDRIEMAENKKLCNALLLKVNQIGSVTEAIDAVKLSYKYGWNVMVSHRSGETEDPFIADLAVGVGSGQIKLGAPCRSDRTSKYNQLLRIEEELGKRAVYGLK